MLLTIPGGSMLFSLLSSTVAQMWGAVKGYNEQPRT